MYKRLLLLFFCSIFTVSLSADPVPPARNKDGSLINGTLEAAFDPLAAVLPYPTNFIFPQSGPIDLTLAPPVADPDDLSDPAVALSSLDGFSTSEKWTTRFVGDAVGLPAVKAPGQIDPTSVVPGQSVRVFEVTTTGYPYLAVTGIVRELTPLAEFYATAADGGILAILPTMPLKEYTTYMAVLTNDINDTRGNDATPSAIYNLAKRRSPLVDANGRSTVPLLDSVSAAALEPLRQLTMLMELSAGSAGVNPDDIVLSWTVHTQSITPTMKILRSLAQPAPTLIVPTGFSTAALGGPGLADIYIGVITVPYYLSLPSAENPIAFLTDPWRAAPGAYLPPYDQAGLDPTSTNLTAVNPIPLQRGSQTIPLIMTVPNVNSGQVKPEGGWPVAIYQHGLTRNRTDMLLVADAAASAGRVLISMDQPLHGVVPGEMEFPDLEVFYIENTPLGAIADERTFDADLENNDTGEPGPDGRIDSAGRWSFNLANLQILRDNIRQAEIDLSVLALSVQNMDLDGDTVPDLDPVDIAGVSNSAGALVMTVAAANEPLITSLYLNAAPVGIIRVLDGGSFGETLHPLLAQAGLIRGTPEYEAFLQVVQTLLDPADAMNWAAAAAARIPVIHNMVIGDLTVPNTIPGAPLAGSEPINRIMGLQPYDDTQFNPEGFSGVARFVQPADHESLFIPVYPEVTLEMQSQMASYIASNGTYVQVGNRALLQPVATPAEPAGEDNNAPAVGAEPDSRVANPVSKQPVSRLEPIKGARNHD